MRIKKEVVYVYSIEAVSNGAARVQSANRACWPIINAEFPHIICAWCTAHVMDLLLEDIGKMDFFKEIWAQGKAVVIWIRGHQSFAAKFSKISKKSLLLPGDNNVPLCFFLYVAQLSLWQEIPASALPSL